MTDAQQLALSTILRARPSGYPSLFDSSTRVAFEKGFEQMRAIALAAVRKNADDDAGED